MTIVRLFVISVVFACLSTFGRGVANDAIIDVHIDQPRCQLSPVLYGLFFEDINYAADGGLYAELVQNRSFEFYPVDGWAQNSRQLQPLFAWNKVERDGGKVDLKVLDDAPLNKKNTKYLSMAIAEAGTVGVENVGFGGIVIEQGAKYDFSLYARAGSDAELPIDVELRNPDGTVLASGKIDTVSNQWKKHELVLVARESSPQARLVLTTTGSGTLMLDMVSLFPQDTFRGRKNGLRKDLAQSLADLKPRFLRFPGGCIAHGQGLDNAYRWKDTVGDVAERKPNWNLWGYHQTYGLGYFEYMQLCEDIGATPLPVVPLGVSCGFRQPFQFASLDDLQVWIDDALDLIEFANGPVDSEWGKLRAEMGHPEPFNLEYICLGNEEHDTPGVRERFPYFVKAIRARYPDIKISGTSGLGPEIPLYDLMTAMEVYNSDEHYYMSPDWYLRNVNRFDNFDRNKPKIFVGEYASEGNTLFNAVAEAAYLTGVERNGDMVDMTCYAPLFAKIGSTQWTKADLIWFTNKQVVKTPNYYVQQLFASNKGDVYLDNKVQLRLSDKNQTKFAGQVGVGTWRTSIEVESATLNGQPLDFSQWETVNGNFRSSDGLYIQQNRNIEAAVSVAPRSGNGENDVFELRARKTGGDEGFLLVFGFEGKDNYYWWNIGGWGNSQHAIERRVAGQSQNRLISTGGRIEDNRWYDLRVELSPGRVRCLIDGKLVHDYREQPAGVFASPTYDKTSGMLMLKLVNASEQSVATTVRLHGQTELGSEAELITLAGRADAMNTVELEAVKPETTTLPAGDTIELTLPPTSVQLLRIKAK